jgi:hypothetical protein
MTFLGECLLFALLGSAVAGVSFTLGYDMGWKSRDRR